METVLSGIRPTGHLHLGNYFGAVTNFVKMQEQYKCFFFVADYHSLTTHPHPDHLALSVKNVLAEYLACGLDPEKCTLYVQSDLPETAELYLLLNMVSYVGELERSTSFKEKIRTQPDNVNAGLLTYPVLMAADILIHRANKVPVGKDQEQHLEMTRNFAQRFNHLYGSELFPLPVAFNFSGNLVKVPGLDGAGKMGKSEGEGNAVFLTEDPASIRKKVMRAVTDTGPTEKNQTKPETVENLFTLMKLVSTDETVNTFNDAYNNCTIRYGDMKKQLAEDMVKFTEPIREKVKSILADDEYLRRVMKIGAEKARESAKATLKQARELIGMRGSTLIRLQKRTRQMKNIDVENKKIIKIIAEDYDFIFNNKNFNIIITFKNKHDIKINSKYHIKNKEMFNKNIIQVPVIENSNVIDLEIKLINYLIIYDLEKIKINID